MELPGSPSTSDKLAAIETDLATWQETAGPDDRRLAAQVVIVAKNVRSALDALTVRVAALEQLQPAATAPTDFTPTTTQGG